MTHTLSLCCSQLWRPSSWYMLVEVKTVNHYQGSLAVLGADLADCLHSTPLVIQRAATLLLLPHTSISVPCQAPQDLIQNRTHMPTYPQIQPGSSSLQVSNYFLDLIFSINCRSIRQLQIRICMHKRYIIATKDNRYIYLYLSILWVTSCSPQTLSSF